MKRFTSYLTMLVLALTMVASAIPLDALGRSSSSRSSSSSSRGSSWGSSTKSSPSKSTASKPSSSWGKSSTVKSTSRSAKPAVKPMSAADKAAHTKAKAAGTSYKSKTAATSSFKSNPAMKSKYTQTATPGKPAPAIRPSHVPVSTKGANGTTYNVNYNSQYGGYGYMGPSGSWMMYNAMADVAMVSILMRQNSYMVQPTVVAPVAVVQTGSYVGIIFIIVIIGMVVLFVFIGVIKD